MRNDCDVLDGIDYRRWESDLVRLPDPNDEVGRLTREDLRVMKTKKTVFSKTRKNSY